MGNSSNEKVIARNKFIFFFYHIVLAFSCNSQIALLRSICMQSGLKRKSFIRRDQILDFQFMLPLKQRKNNIKNNVGKVSIKKQEKWKRRSVSKINNWQFFYEIRYYFNLILFHKTIHFYSRWMRFQLLNYFKKLTPIVLSNFKLIIIKTIFI